MIYPRTWFTTSKTERRKIKKLKKLKKRKELKKKKQKKKKLKSWRRLLRMLRRKRRKNEVTQDPFGFSVLTVFCTQIQAQSVLLLAVLILMVSFILTLKLSNFHHTIKNKESVDVVLFLAITTKLQHFFPLMVLYIQLLVQRALPSVVLTQMASITHTQKLLFPVMLLPIRMTAGVPTT